MSDPDPCALRAPGRGVGARRRAALVRLLAVSEFRLRDQGTFLGFLWTLLHPAFLFLVLWVVFRSWMGPKVPGFPAYLLVGVVVWRFLTGAISVGMTSLSRRRTLLLALPVPYDVVVASAVGSVWMPHLLEMAVLAGALLALGVPIGPGWALLPVVVAAWTAVALGAASVLAAMQARWRDIERIWGIVEVTALFLTPVFYPIDLVQPAFRPALWLNPATSAVACARHALLGVPAPAYAWWLLGGWGASLLVVGAWALRRVAPDAAEVR